MKNELIRQQKDIAKSDNENLSDSMFKRIHGNENQNHYDFDKSLKKTKLYHFKVIQLFAHLDTRSEAKYVTDKDGKSVIELIDDKSKGFSEVALKFHFFHKLLCPFKAKDETEKYDWYLGDDIRHRLYLSSHKRMLEVIQGRLAYLWRRIDEKDDGQLIQ